MINFWGNSYYKKVLIYYSISLGRVWMTPKNSIFFATDTWSPEF